MNRQVLRALLLAAATVSAATAQFELFLVDGNVERPVPAVYDFGTLYGGESILARFRIRNTSTAAATLSVLAVAGEGFTLSAPAVPIGLNPQASVEFTVAFSAQETGKYRCARCNIYDVEVSQIEIAVGDLFPICDNCKSINKTAQWYPLTKHKKS